jgi:hypothetical protein
MDDIAYFGSLDYLHRGGIWADAVRREKHTTPDSDPTQPSPPSCETETAESVASLPVVIPPAEEVMPVLNRSRSAEELRKEEPTIVPEVVAVRTTTPTSPPTTAASSSGKRRTWLSSVLGNETDSSDDDVSDSGSRGRDSHPRGITPASSRSTSSHSDGVSDQAHDSGLLSPSPKRPPPLPQRRSPSGERYEVPPITPPRTPQFSQTTASTSTTSSSPPASFFSTLKARAGDKQALSNTAKEAMKKWSANWGTSKREASDDSPDAGTQDRDSQSKRGSYADVRRNVEDRQRTISMVEPGDMDTHLPNGIQDKDRVTNTTSLNGRRGLRTGSISGLFATPSPVIDPSTSASSEGKESTEPHGDVPDTTAPLPIHTQPPQAKTMTIPGIHASHRGEVMSMGYVREPSPPAPEPKQIVAPAIQSVYRRWKNPPNQQNLDTQPEASVPDVSSTRQPPKPNMVPPPLPPRSTSATIIRPTSEAPRSNFSSSNDPSSASVALKAIATQDESRRGSMDRVEAVEGSEMQNTSSS